MVKGASLQVCWSSSEQKENAINLSLRKFLFFEVFWSFLTQAKLSRLLSNLCKLLLLLKPEAPQPNVIRWDGFTKLFEQDGGKLNRDILHAWSISYIYYLVTLRVLQIKTKYFFIKRHVSYSHIWSYCTLASFWGKLRFQEQRSFDFLTGLCSVHVFSASNTKLYSLFIRRGLKLSTLWHAKESEKEALILSCLACTFGFIHIYP